MAAGGLTKQEKELFNELKRKPEALVREWLEELKKGPDDQSKVINLLTGNRIYTNRDTGIYPVIIRWCILNIKDFDFKDIPNYDKILSMIEAKAVAASGSAASAAAASAAAATSNIISVLKKWREYPTLDPNTGVLLSVSIRHGSAYAELYKDCISKLIKHIFKIKKGSNADTLTVKDCKFIKDSMPNIHAVTEIKDAGGRVVDTIFYDHLFAKYFLRLKGVGKHIHDNVYKYDDTYMEDIEIYLYLIVYDTFMENMDRDPNAIPDGFYNTEQLLKSKYVYFTDSDYALGYLVQNLCADVKQVLYMHESKITTENINTASYHKEVLKYMLSVYKISMNNTEIVAEITQLYRELYLDYDNITKQYTNKFNLRAISADRKHSQNNIFFIYRQIVDFIAKDANVCKTLLAIYDDILKLYADSNMKKTAYKPIKDPYNTNKGVEPQIPRRAQLPIDLQRYKMTTAAPSAPKNPETERLLKDYDDKWKAQLKEYERKKDIYDRIYEGKVSPKHRMWNGERMLSPQKLLRQQQPHKSVSPPKVSFVKYDKIHKAFTASPIKKYRSNGSGDDDYYVNDSDPYTQEPFADMHPNKRKNVADIVYVGENNKTFHFRFDTVSIYNYLLECIRDCVKPINFINKTLLTKENIDEICRKIKYFTKKPTYNSSLEIMAILDNCYYNNKLVFNYSEQYLPYRTDNPIIGYFRIYLNLKLGGVLFRVVNKLPPDVLVSDYFPNQTNPANAEVAVLPLFADYIKDAYFDDITYDFPEYILMDMQTKLAKGGFLTDKYYPNRKNNKDGERWKKVIQIPSFPFNEEDDGDVAFDKLKKYREKMLII
jgi:hypothetical protein